MVKFPDVGIRITIQCSNYLSCANRCGTHFLAPSVVGQYLHHCMTDRRMVKAISLTGLSSEYEELRADPNVRILSEQDFGMKDDILRVVDYTERQLLLPAPEPVFTIPIC